MARMETMLPTLLILVAIITFVAFAIGQHRQRAQKFNEGWQAFAQHVNGEIKPGPLFSSAGVHWITDGRVMLLEASRRGKQEGASFVDFTRMRMTVQTSLKPFEVYSQRNNDVSFSVSMQAFPRSPIGLTAFDAEYVVYSGDSESARLLLDDEAVQLLSTDRTDATIGLVLGVENGAQFVEVKAYEDETRLTRLLAWQVLLRRLGQKLPV
jgi:hypothetical protein